MSVAFATILVAVSSLAPDFISLFCKPQCDVTDALEGDPKYMAPELMQGSFTQAADMFRCVRKQTDRPISTRA